MTHPYEVELPYDHYWYQMSWDYALDKMVNPIHQWFVDHGFDVLIEQRCEGPPMEVHGINFSHQYKSSLPTSMAFFFRDKRSAMLFKLTWC